MYMHLSAQATARTLPSAEYFKSATAARSPDALPSAASGKKSSPSMAPVATTRFAAPTSLGRLPPPLAFAGTRRRCETVQPRAGEAPSQVRRTSSPLSQPRAKVRPSGWKASAVARSGSRTSCERRRSAQSQRRSVRSTPTDAATAAVGCAATALMRPACAWWKICTPTLACAVSAAAAAARSAACMAARMDFGDVPSAASAPCGGVAGGGSSSAGSAAEERYGVSTSAKAFPCVPTTRRFSASSQQSDRAGPRSGACAATATSTTHSKSPAPAATLVDCAATGSGGASSQTLSLPSLPHDATRERPRCWWLRCSGLSPATQISCTGDPSCAPAKTATQRPRGSQRHRGARGDSSPLSCENSCSSA
mmetsp:Transcript_28378/g.95553  ORF Transcript_28378/g.95553 Transcript_28378/m.95553 type:complete len:366 (-) Transcript_28378:961-2058(-)